VATLEGGLCGNFNAEGAEYTEKNEAGAGHAVMGWGKLKDPRQSWAVYWVYCKACDSFVGC